MQTVLIRQAQPEDSASITRIVNQAYRPEPGKEGWTHEASLVTGARVTLEQVNVALQNSVVLVAVIERSVQGCIRIEVDGQSAHIGMLAVNPSLQNSGIGKRLLSEAETFAVRHLDANEAVLTVIAVRKELLDFYQRCGYRETGSFSSFPVDAGVGIPCQEAMMLTILRKVLAGQAERDACA